YRFDKPGPYEVRYTRRRGLPATRDSQPVVQTAWTQIEILPAQHETPHPEPEDPAEELSDYLPSILGFPDDAHLTLVTGYLYHPNDTSSAVRFTGPRLLAGGRCQSQSHPSLAYARAERCSGRENISNAGRGRLHSAVPSIGRPGADARRNY